MPSILIQTRGASCQAASTFIQAVCLTKLTRVMVFPFGFVFAGLRLVYGLTSPAALRPVVVVLVLLIPAV